MRARLLNAIWSFLERTLPQDFLSSAAQDVIFREVVRGTCADGGLYDLFQRDREEGFDFARMAAALKMPSQSARVLLLMACTLGMLEKRGDRYYATPYFFKERGFRDELHLKLVASMAFFSESCRKGVNAGLQMFPGEGETLYQRMAAYPELEQQYSRGLAESALRARVPWILEALKGMPDVRHLLDVGGNTGVTARAIAGANPDVRVTVFDLPSIAEAGNAANRVEENKEERVQFMGGNAFTDPFPAADCVLFSAFLEVVPEPDVPVLLRKAYDALPEDGRVIIVQTACNDMETGPYSAAFGTLFFFNVCAPQTMTYPVADFRKWGEQIGFRSVERISPEDEPLATMILRK